MTNFHITLMVCTTIFVVFISLALAMVAGHLIGDLYFVYVLAFIIIWALTYGICCYIFPKLTRPYTLNMVFQNFIPTIEKHTASITDATIDLPLTTGEFIKKNYKRILSEYRPRFICILTNKEQRELTEAFYKLIRKYQQENGNLDKALIEDIQSRIPRRFRQELQPAS